MRRPRCADRLIVALDMTTLTPALVMAQRLRGLVRTVKIGSALFTAQGPVAIQRMRRLGFDVMLDLKFFDIPSTVELSARAAAHHRVSMFTVHATGGLEMLRAAVRGACGEARRLRERPPQVLAVTVLTSVEAPRSRRLAEYVVRLARTALAAGCDGVVASAQEALVLHRQFGRRLRIVCPGIRPTSTRHSDPSPRSPHASTGSGSSRAKSRDDQQRVCTPREALACGADVLVVGRPITAARNPRAATEMILHEMEEHNPC